MKICDTVLLLESQIILILDSKGQGSKSQSPYVGM